MPKESEYTEANFSPISTDSLCLWVAQIPRSLAVAIFIVTTTTDKTDCFTPCACTRVSWKWCLGIRLQCSYICIVEPYKASRPLTMQFWANRVKVVTFICTRSRAHSRGNEDGHEKVKLAVPWREAVARQTVKLGALMRRRWGDYFMVSHQHSSAGSTSLVGFSPVS